MRLMKRLMFILRRDRFDRDLEDELRFHLEAKVRENLAAGMPLDYLLALRAARVDPMVALRYE